MSNDIAKALKQKTDAMLRLQGQSQKPVVYENVDGSYTAPEKSDYTAALAAGKNIQILTSGNIKTIHAVMGLLAGDNISIPAPDASGKVIVSGTIAGKGINIADFANKNGYVLTYDSASDKFILAAQSGSLAQATETILGGIKAKDKTTETSEVAIDPETGRLYSQMPSGASVNNQRTSTALFFWVGSEAEYQAITTPDANTLYFRS